MGSAKETVISGVVEMLDVPFAGEIVMGVPSSVVKERVVLESVSPPTLILLPRIIT